MDKLNEWTQKIKECEERVSKNYIWIGRLLNRVKQSGMYKQEYKTFEEYVLTNFGFTVRTAQRMMLVSGCDDVVAYGLWKAIELLKMPEKERKKFISSYNIEQMSVRELRAEIDGLDFSEIKGTKIKEPLARDKKYKKFKRAVTNIEKLVDEELFPENYEEIRRLISELVKRIS